MKYNVYDTPLGVEMEKESVVKEYAKEVRYDSSCPECPDELTVILGGRDAMHLPFLKYPACIEGYTVLDLRKFAIEDTANRKFKLRSKSNAPFYISMAIELDLAKKNKSMLPDVDLIRLNAELIVTAAHSQLALSEEDKLVLRYTALANQLVTHLGYEKPAKLLYIFKQSVPFTDIKDSDIYELLQQKPGLESILITVKEMFNVSDRLNRTTVDVLKSLLFKVLPGFSAEVILGLELLPVQAVLATFALTSPLGKRSQYGNMLMNLRKSKLIRLDEIADIITKHQ